MKLEIELIPYSNWQHNLRTLFTKQVWDEIRHKVYKRYNYKCGICGANGMLHCHEVWSYDDKKHIQKLVGFIALCPQCHMIKHIGMAGVLASQGKLDMERLIQHFMKVNQCTREEFQQHYNEAIATFKERSKHAWTLSL